MKKVYRRIGMVLGIVVGLLVLGISAKYMTLTRQLNRTYEFASENIIIPSDEQSIENGKKWVQATCSSCHGADLSGTTMISDPAIGRVDSANLTSGMGGIASTYTDEDWARALRHSVGPDGKPFIIMPSSAFWNFSDEDLGDVIAYLKTVPPVDHETTVKLAFIGTMVLTNDPSVLHVNLIDHNSRPAEPVVGTTIEYGEYLVNVNGCRECHANNLSGRPIIHGRPATPNITPGGELGLWSVEDFINTMRTGVAPSKHALDPKEMPWPGYSLYSDDELTAVYLYLQSLQVLPSNSQ